MSLLFNSWNWCLRLPQLLSMSDIVDSVLNAIRGTPPSKNGTTMPIDPR
jgi:hypothetical protein